MVDSGIIETVHDRRVIAIREDLSTEWFVFPILLLVKQNNLNKSSSKGPFADKTPLCGQPRSEIYFVDTARRHSHNQQIPFNLFPSFINNNAFILFLDYLFGVVVELYHCSFVLYLLAQINAHVLSAQLRLLLLQTVLHVYQVIETLGLVDIVQEVEKTDLSKLNTKNDSHCSLHHQLKLGKPNVLIQPTLESNRIPLISQLAVSGVEGGNLPSHPVDLPDAPLQLQQSNNIDLIGNIRCVCAYFIFEWYDLFAIRVDRSNLILRLYG